MVASNKEKPIDDIKDYPLDWQKKYPMKLKRSKDLTKETRRVVKRVRAKFDLE